MTSAVTRPLRIGVLLNSTTVNAWTWKILKEIAEADFCTLAVAVIDDRSAPQLTRWQRAVARVRGWWWRGLYDLYVRWDRARYRTDKDAFEMRDASALLPEDVRLHVVPLAGKFVDRFAKEDIETIRNADLDVILRFGFRILKGEILDCARHGVWSYHHGDNRLYRGGPPLFWEIYERNSASGTVLQVLSEELDGGHVLYRSWSSTNFESLNLNRNPVYWKTSTFVMRCLRQLHERGWEYLAGRESQDGKYERRIYRPPTNFQMLPFLARKAVAVVRNKLFRNHDHWRVVVRPAGSWQENQMERGKDIHLVPGEDRFYADPFLLKREGRNFLFFEDYRYADEKGLIAFVEIRLDGSLSEPEVVLERDYHLSYPFVFERDGEIYMIPETKQANRVELYRAVDFPHKWRMERVLIPDIAAVDATLHDDGERLWLFCNVGAPGASNCDELHLFSAAKLEGPWQAHPCNPVVSDVRRARPAGRLFVHNGELVRPAQDCSVAYGHAVTLNRVIELSGQEYREEPFARIGPEWLAGNQGTHTLEQNEDFEVVDANIPLRQLRIPRRARFVRLQQLLGR